MKNTLKYFYNLNNIEIIKKEENYIIKSKYKIYLFYKVNNYLKNIDKIYELNVKMINNNYFIYPIVHNKYSDIITNYNNNSFVLIQIGKDYNELITLNDIISFQRNMYNNKYIIQWKQFWMNKIDYIEYQLEHLGKRYPLIRESMPYFIGMTENAISMLNEEYEINGFYQHRRISINMKKIDYYNPFNIIIDSRVRDLSEYFKINFIYNKNTEIGYINLLTPIEKELFYIRLFYITPYFDLSEKILYELEEQKKLNNIIDLTDEYQKMLKKIATYISNYNIKLPNVEWL